MKTWFNTTGVNKGKLSIGEVGHQILMANRTSVSGCFVVLFKLPECLPSHPRIGIIRRILQLYIMHDGSNHYICESEGTHHLPNSYIA